MASVQELLALAEAQNADRSPIASSMGNLLLGMQQAQNQSLQRAQALIAMDENRKAIQRAEEEDRQVRGMLEKQQEDAIKQGFSSVSGAGKPVLPSQKLETVITKDDMGRYRRNIKVIDNSSQPISYQKTEYQDAKGQARIGRWNPSTGVVEKTPDDPLAPVTRDTGSDPINRAKQLRGEFNDLSKDFFKVNEAVSRVRASVKNPSAGGDLALIFNYMKVLDPGSVVREGEFATAANAAGVPDRLRAQYNKVISGERLAPDTRNDFADRTERLFEAQKEIHELRKREYSRLAEAQGVDPEQVIVNQVIGKMDKEESVSGGGKLPDVTKMSDEELRRIANGQ